MNFPLFHTLGIPSTTFVIPVYRGHLYLCSRDIFFQELVSLQTVPETGFPWVAISSNNNFNWREKLLVKWMLPNYHSGSIEEHLLLYCTPFENFRCRSPRSACIPEGGVGLWFSSFFTHFFNELNMIDSLNQLFIYKLPNLGKTADNYWIKFYIALPLFKQSMELID